MSKIAAYVRVSTQEQLEEGSHINQRESVANWVERNDYDPGEWGEYHIDTDDWQHIDEETTADVDWFEDLAISGQSQNRNAYQRLMDAYPDYDAVVVRELSRFGRDPLTVLRDVEDIVDSETEFVSINEDFDTSSAMGKAFVRIVAVINGMYADLRREQAIRAAERRKEQGLPVGRPRKLSDAHIQEVLDLRSKEVSYSAIARIMEDKPNGPESISRETIRQYCQEQGDDAE